MAKYKNKAGTIVEPASDIAAETFEKSKEWKKVAAKTDGQADDGSGGGQG